jgi:hypothetical protein
MRPAEPERLVPHLRKHAKLGSEGPYFFMDRQAVFGTSEQEPELVCVHKVP